MDKKIGLRRPTDNDGDVLIAEGVDAALRIGRGLSGDYQVMVSSGAQRATQTLACLAGARSLRPKQRRSARRSSGSSTGSYQVAARWSSATAD